MLHWFSGLLSAFSAIILGVSPCTRAGDATAGFNPRRHDNANVQTSGPGRQIEDTNNAAVEFNCRMIQLRTILRNVRYEIHLLASRPFQSEDLFSGFSGLKPLIGFFIARGSRKLIRKS